MKQNISSNIPSAKFSRKPHRNTLFTEPKHNSAFKLVVPDAEIMICHETLAPSRLENQLVELGRDYKSTLRLHFNPQDNINYLI
jgi:hypothetical protein